MYVVISRFSRDGFKPAPHYRGTPPGLKGVSGVWAFIRGAENTWSLNHLKGQEARKFWESVNLWVAEIPRSAKVYDFLGRLTTAGEVFDNAIRTCAACGHFNLDHEDAGFYVPEKECKKIRGITKLERQYWAIPPRLA